MQTEHSHFVAKTTNLFYGVVLKALMLGCFVPHDKVVSTLDIMHMIKCTLLGEPGYEASEFVYFALESVISSILPL